MAETKYGKYIIREPKANIVLPEFRQKSLKLPPGTSTRVGYVDDEVIEGSFYVEAVWFWEGSDKARNDAHTHDFDEVIAFYGTNPDDWRDLGGEIEIWLGDEKHTITESCIIFVPRGLKHCPLTVKRVDRPIFHFTTGNGRMYL